MAEEIKTTQELFGDTVSTEELFGTQEQTFTTEQLFKGQNRVKETIEKAKRFGKWAITPLATEEMIGKLPIIPDVLKASIYGPLEYMIPPPLRKKLSLTELATRTSPLGIAGEAAIAIPGLRELRQTPKVAKAAKVMETVPLISKIKPSKGEAVSKINLTKYTPEVQEGIKNIITKHPEAIKRKVISHSELESIAKKLSDTPVIKKILSLQEGELAAEALKLRQGEDAIIRSALQSDLGDMGNNIKNVIKLRQTQAVGRVGTELGRALEQQKIPITAQQEIASIINSKISQVRKDPTLGKDAKRLVAGLVELRKTVLTKDFNPSWFDKGYEFWLNNILSGPWTHTVNVVSNTLFTAVKPIEKSAYAAIDIPLSWFTGKRTHYFSEIPQQVKGVTKLISRKELPGGVTPGAKFALRQPQIKGIKGELLRIPTKALVAEDNYAKRLNGFMELYGRAEAIAKQEGLTGPALVARRNQLISQPTGQLLGEVSREQLMRTFQDATGLGELIRGLPQRFFRWILPFRNTLSSIITKGLERTPLGFLKVAKRAALKKAVPYPQYEAAIDIGNASMGTALSAGLTYGFLKGNLTGAPPKERAKRDLFYAQGKQPYSLRVGNKWIPFGRIEPWGTAAMMTLDLIQGYQESDKDLPTSKAIDSVSNLTKSLSSKSFLSGMTMFVMAATQPERYAENFLTRFASGFMPWAGFQRNVTRMTDMGVKETEGLVQSLMKDVPILSKRVPNRINVLGKEIKREPQGWSKFVPFPITKDKQDLVIDELVRLDYPMGYPSKKMKIGIGEMKLDRKDYRRFLIGTGKAQYGYLYNLFSDPRYWMLPEEIKTKFIRSTMSSMRTIGRMELGKEQQVKTTEELFVK